MKNAIGLSLCLSLLLVGCGQELAPTAASYEVNSEAVLAAKTTQMIPHKGEVVIHPTAVVPTGDPLVVHVFYEGEGEATHLGRYNEIGDYLLHSDADGIPLFVSDANIRLIAANGDRLFIANLTGVFSLTGDPDHPTTVTGEYDFAGGTGRFAEVSGHCRFWTIGNADGTVISQFEGMISRVGSGQ